MNLGQNIATLRKEFGFTQEELAEKCDVSRQAVTKWESGASEPTIEKLLRLSEIFGVSVDELINGTEVAISRQNRIIDDLSHEVFSSILSLNDNRILGCSIYSAHKDMLLRILYKVIGQRYFDNNGKLEDRYLVSNTSKKDRASIVSYAEHTFSEEEYNPSKDYIEGLCEIDEALEKIDIELEKRVEGWLEQCDTKKDSKSVLGHRACACIRIKDFDDCTDMYINKVKNNLHDRMSDINGETLVERLLIFFEKEIDTAIDRKDAEALKEITDDMWALADYFWYKG